MTTIYETIKHHSFNWPTEGDISGLNLNYYSPNQKLFQIVSPFPLRGDCTGSMEESLLCGSRSDFQHPVPEKDEILNVKYQTQLSVIWICVSNMFLRSLMMNRDCRRKSGPLWMPPIMEGEESEESRGWRWHARCNDTTTIQTTIWFWKRS